MYLEQLQVRNVRAISGANLQFSSTLNLITGVNGSGKTSLLESIYLLGVGRSFRTNQIKRVINSSGEELTVFGKLSNPAADSLGISRDRTGSFKVRINSIDQNKLSSLAHYLPVLVITPDSYKLITSGPQHRRQFLDFSVFHVEQGFSSAWQRYNRILKQRNALLKNCKSYQELSVWDKEFTQLATGIHQVRINEFLRLKKHLEVIQGIFLPQYRVQYHLCSGWDFEAEQQFSEQLEACFNIDRRYGYSTIGAHKVDIKITIENQPVQDILSRGEQKMLVNAMHIAQAKRLSVDLEKNCLLLIDDLPSELDHKKQQLLINELTNLPDVQLFITAISGVELDKTRFKQEKSSTKVFHVEHGNVSVVEN